jgi:hypothetical protein
MRGQETSVRAAQNAEPLRPVARIQIGTTPALTRQYYLARITAANQSPHPEKTLIDVLGTIRESQRGISENIAAMRRLQRSGEPAANSRIIQSRLRQLIAARRPLAQVSRVAKLELLKRRLGIAPGEIEVPLELQESYAVAHDILEGVGLVGIGSTASPEKLEKELARLRRRRDVLSRKGLDKHGTTVRGIDNAIMHIEQHMRTQEIE